MSEPAVVEVPQSARAAKVAVVSPGQIIGERYRVEGLIGEGGMGIVCRATHITLETPVAIKLIRPDFKDDVELVQRFLNEARRAAGLKSERVTHVHDVGQLETGEPYLVMELLEGVELEKYLAQHGRLPVVDAVNVAIQICEGLAEAHAAGIVHRDIKPSNAFLVRRCDGRFSVKILDFGISKQMFDGTTSLTNRDQSLGSPQYMSPEQMLDPTSVDHRSDIWSVGVVLFELLTGKLPFDGTSMPEVCAKVLTTPAPKLRSVLPELEPELEAIVTRCLEKNPASRFRDVAALGQALQRFACIHVSGAPHVVETTAFFEPVVDVVADDMGSLAPLARPSVPPARPSLPPPRPGARHARWAGALGVAAAVALGVVAFGRASIGASDGATASLGWPTEATPVLASGPAPAALSAPERSYPLAVASNARAERRHFGSGAVALGGPGLPADASAHASTRERPSDYALSPAEIRRRIDRYQRWLDEQGLMRLDSVEDDPSYLKDAER